MPALEFPELSSIQQKLEMCRIDYLFGEGGKRPCRDTEALSKRHGLTTLQIAKHAPSWLAELRANAVAASMTYGKATDPITVEAHQGDVAWLREQVDILEKKMSKLPDDAKGLETYEFMLRQVLKMQKRWSELAGVESAIKVSTLAQITMAREEVKLLVNREAEQPPPRDGSDAREVLGPVFNMDEG